MSYWVLTANGTVFSTSTIFRVTNLEDQTDENKASITALDKAFLDCLNNKYHVIFQGGKGEPKDLSEHPLYRDRDFQEEFSHVISNEEVAEADDDCSPDVYDDTYLIMDLAPP